MEGKNLEISWSTILKIIIAGFLLYVLFLAREIVIWFFFALIISLLVEPVVNFLRKIYIPKIAAVILVYSSIFILLGAMIYSTAPVLIFEINQLSGNIPDYFEKLSPVFSGLGIIASQSFEEFTKELVFGLRESSSGILKAASVFFGGIASTMVIFAFAFYISLEEKGFERVLVLLTPKKYEEYVLSIFERAQLKVAGWFGARILACLFVAVASFVVFFLFGVKYSFILSVIAGVLNFIPFIGPLITAILAVLFVSASNSLFLALYVLIAFILIQIAEGNIITPLLMQKLINLPPVLVLIALLLGGILFGLLGMIFIVPVFGIAYEFLKEFLVKKKEQEQYLNLS